MLACVARSLPVLPLLHDLVLLMCYARLYFIPYFLTIFDHSLPSDLVEPILRVFYTVGQVFLSRRGTRTHLFLLSFLAFIDNLSLIQFFARIVWALNKYAWNGVIGVSQ